MTSSSESRAASLQKARERFAARAWQDAYDAFNEADVAAPLEVEDLWRMSSAASLCGRETVGMALLERVYQAEVERDAQAAGRAAFWLGFRLVHLEPSRGRGWLARAERCLERAPEACVERGYMFLPEVRQHFAAGRYAEAMQAAKAAEEAGERFGERDLATFARNLRGRILIRQGELEAGMKLLDEAMLAVTSGELSPVLTGLIYCAAIDSCQSVYALERMREWTDSLRGWCDAQPQLTLFTGACLVSRAEILEVAGEWGEALEEARRAAQELGLSYGPRAVGEAVYREAEILRLRGELTAAEARYRDASEAGRDPQPGLALLRRTQGRADVGVQALRRAAAASTQPLSRVRLLPALVELLLATGALEEARTATNELSEIAGTFGTPVLRAIAAQTRGAVELQEGDAAASFRSLSEAFRLLQELGAPYLTAQARVQLACACQALGDEDTAALEIAAARAAFVKLGAQTDVQAIDALVARAAGPGAFGLSSRELTVLRLVASGKTNRLIARELCLSEKTVDRHVSNIFDKLNVPSRAAATAFAYEKKLL